MKKIGGIIVTAVVVVVFVSLADFSAAAAYPANDHLGKVAIKEDVIKESGNSSELPIQSDIIMMESPSPAIPPTFSIIAAHSTNNKTASTPTVVEYVDIGDKLSRL